MSESSFVSRNRGLLAQLNSAYAAGDQGAFDTTLDKLLGNRESVVLTGMQRLSDSLFLALARFHADSRIEVLAEQEIPDARQRLDHVLAVTEEAAHKTLDLIEQSVPLADATVRSARDLTRTLDDRSHNDIRRFLDEARGNFEIVRGNLTEVMLTQGFQDVTGQILGGVRKLICEVEGVLAELAQLTGARSAAPARTEDRGLQGPAVPGVTRNALTSQSDVDELIGGLGL